MLLSSKGGTISAIKIVRETSRSWTLIDDKVEIKVSKGDQTLRVFKLMSEALAWANADPEMIEYFKEIEAQKATASDQQAPLA